jgi:hypothetical protein
LVSVSIPITTWAVGVTAELTHIRHSVVGRDIEVFSDVERRVGEGDINSIRDVWCVGQLEAKRLRSVPEVFFDLKLGDGDKVMRFPERTEASQRVGCGSF